MSLQALLHSLDFIRSDSSEAATEFVRATTVIFEPLCNMIIYIYASLKDAAPADLNMIHSAWLIALYTFACSLTPPSPPILSVNIKEGRNHSNFNK